MEWLTQWFADSGALLVALLAAVVGPVLIRRSSKDDNKNDFIAQQRESFKDLIDPLREEVADLRGRVTTLEAEVRTERDLRERIVAFTRTVLWTWRRRYPDDAHPAPPESIRSFFD